MSDQDFDDFLSDTRKQLNDLVATCSNFSANLSESTKAIVEELEEIQDIMKGLQYQYKLKCHELERQYHALQEPLYQRMKDLISGKLEPSKASCKSLRDETLTNSTATAHGIPHFWLHTLTHHLSFHRTIADHDHPALEHLINIRTEYLNDQDDTTCVGYRLVFDFIPNEFFENTTLSKEYRFKREIGLSGELVYGEAVGTPIRWKRNNNLTEWVDNNGRDSFFQFFSPQSPITQELLDAGWIDDETIAAVEDQVEQDYQLGGEIKDQIVPHALDWFTGRAWAQRSTDHMDSRIDLAGLSLRADHAIKALLWACEYGYDTIVRAFLKEGSIDPNIRDKNGWTPLTLAVKNGQNNVASMLLKKETIDINLPTQGGLTPLGVAIGNTNSSMVELLLAHSIGFSLTSAPLDGNAGIVRALLSRATEAKVTTAEDFGPLVGLLKLLLNPTIHVNDFTETDEGLNQLALCAQHGHTGAIQLLIEEMKIHVDRLTWKAAWFRYEELVQTLLKENQINLRYHPKNSHCILHGIASYCGGDTLRIVLDQGLDPNTKTDLGFPLLKLASGGKDESTATLLLTYPNVNVHARSDTGDTALHSAASAGHEAVAKILLERGIEVDSANEGSQTPLWFACQNGHPTIVKLLIETGRANINVCAQPGNRSALYVAAYAGHEDVVRLLLDQKDIRINLADEDGWSPYDVAIEQEYDSIANLLSSRGGRSTQGGVHQ